MQIVIGYIHIVCLILCALALYMCPSQLHFHKLLKVFLLSGLFLNYCSGR